MELRVALLVCVLVAVGMTAGFAFLGMMWISVVMRRLMRDGRPAGRPDAAEPAE